MKKTIASAIVATVMAVSIGLVGCGSNQSSSAQSSSSAQEQTTSSSSEAASSSAAAASSSEAASSSSEQASSSAATTSSATTGQISVDEAKAIALADAGLTEADVTELSAHLDEDDGVIMYDVDFKSGGMEHDYDIDPVTGAVINHTSEIDD